MKLIFIKNIINHIVMASLWHLSHLAEPVKRQQRATLLSRLVRLSPRSPFTFAFHSRHSQSCLALYIFFFVANIFLNLCIHLSATKIMFIRVKCLYAAVTLVLIQEALNCRCTIGLVSPTEANLLLAAERERKGRSVALSKFFKSLLL